MLRYKTIESLIDLKIKEGSQVLHPCKPSLNSAFNCCYVLRDGASVKTNIWLFLETSKFCLLFEVELFAFPDIYLRTTGLALVLVLRHVCGVRVAVLIGLFHFDSRDTEILLPGLLGFPNLFLGDVRGANQ